MPDQKFFELKLARKLMNIIYNKGFFLKEWEIIYVYPLSYP